MTNPAYRFSRAPGRPPKARNRAVLAADACMVACKRLVTVAALACLRRDHNADKRVAEALLAVDEARRVLATLDAEKTE